MPPLKNAWILSQQRTSQGGEIPKAIPEAPAEAPTETQQRTSLGGEIEIPEISAQTPTEVKSTATTELLPPRGKRRSAKPEETE